MRRLDTILARFNENDRLAGCFSLAEARNRPLDVRTPLLLDALERMTESTGTGEDKLLYGQAVRSRNHVKRAWYSSVYSGASTISVSRTLPLVSPCIQAAIEIVQEAAYPLKKKALEALSQFEAPGLVEALALSLEDDDVVAEAVSALAAIGNDSARDLLLKTLHKLAGRPMYGDALAEMGSFPCEQVFSRLVDEISRCEPEEQAMIAYSLSAFHGASDALVTLISGGHDIPVLYALMSLEAVGDPGCVEAVAALLDQDKPPVIREVVYRVLGCIDSDGVVPALLRGLGERNDAVRAQAVESLARCGMSGPELQRRVAPCLYDDSALVWSNAVLALGDVSPGIALRKIRQVLDEGDDSDRAFAVHCLGHFHNGRSIEIITGLAKEKGRVLGAEIVGALAGFPEQEAGDLLAGLLEHEQADVRLLAAMSLRRRGRGLGDGCHAALWTSIGKESDVRVKAEMVRTISAFARMDDFGRLMDLLELRIPTVSAAAVDGLSRIAPDETVSQLEPLLDSREASLKVSVAIALLNRGNTDVAQILLADLQSDDIERIQCALESLYHIGVALRDREGEVTRPAPWFEWPAFEPADDEYSRAIPEEDENIKTAAFALPLIQRTDEDIDGAAALDFEEVLRLWEDDDRSAAFTLAGKLADEKAFAGAGFFEVRLLLENRQEEQAIERLKKLTRESPGFVNPHLLLFRLLKKRGVTDEAFAHFSMAVKQAVVCLEEQVRLAFELINSGRMEKAARFLSEGREQLPAMEAIVKRTGVLLLMVGRGEAAYEHLLLAHANDPDDTGLVLPVGLAALQSGRTHYARHMLSSFLTLSDGDVRQARKRRRQAVIGLSETGPDEFARKVLEELVNNETDEDVRRLALRLSQSWRDKTFESSGVGGAPFELVLERAIGLFRNGQVEKAHEVAANLAEGSGKPLARFFMAKTALAVGKASEAGAVFQQLSKDDRRYIPAELALVALCQKAGAYREMAVYFLRAMQAALELLSGQIACMDDQLEKGNGGPVQAFWQALCAELPYIDKLHGRMGLLALMAKNFELSFRHFMLAHGASPFDEGRAVGLALAAERLGQHELARRICVKLLKRVSKEGLGDESLHARRNALVCLSRLPVSREVFEVFKSVITCGDAHPELQYLARRFFHEWRENFEEPEEVDNVQVFEGESFNGKAARKIFSQADRQGKLAITRQIIDRAAKASLSFVLDALSEEEDPFVISSLVKAVGAIGDRRQSTWAILQEFLKHPDSRVRSNTVESLEMIGDDLLWPILVPMLKDPDNRVKANTLKALLQFDEGEAGDVLRKMGASPDEGSRDSAFYCLSQVKKPWVEDILVHMAECEVSDVLLRKECRLLAEIGTRKSLDVLLAAIERSEKGGDSTDAFLAAELMNAGKGRSEIFRIAVEGIQERLGIKDDTPQEEEQDDSQVNLSLDLLEGVSDKVKPSPYDSRAISRVVPKSAIDDEDKHKWKKRKKSRSRAPVVDEGRRKRLFAGSLLLTVLLVLLGITYSGDEHPKGPMKGATETTFHLQVLKIEDKNKTVWFTKGSKPFVGRFPKDYPLTDIKAGDSVSVIGILTREKEGVARVIWCKSVKQAKDDASVDQTSVTSS